MKTTEYDHLSTEDFIALLLAKAPQHALFQEAANRLQAAQALIDCLTDEEGD